ncbi:hypothetical protein V6N13_076883 [Hibiscus sabdariffa]
MSLCMDLQQWECVLRVLEHGEKGESLQQLYFIYLTLSLSLSLSPLHLLTGFCWLCYSPSSLTVRTVWEKAWCCLVQRQ